MSNFASHTKLSFHFIDFALIILNVFWFRWRLRTSKTDEIRTSSAQSSIWMARPGIDPPSQLRPTGLHGRGGRHQSSTPKHQTHVPGQITKDFGILRPSPARSRAARTERQRRTGGWIGWRWGASQNQGIEALKGANDGLLARRFLSVFQDR